MGRVGAGYICIGGVWVFYGGETDMMLGEIRSYLQQRGTATLNEVAVHFDIAADTARFALNYWQKKGKVRERAAGCAAGGCAGGGCGGQSAAVYAWVKREIPLRWMPYPSRNQNHK
jgi:hypothetical protein